MIFEQDRRIVGICCGNINCESLGGLGARVSRHIHVGQEMLDLSSSLTWMST